jgi:hypothetical protein
MAMSPRNKFVTTWTPRIGNEAAELQRRFVRVVGYGGLLVPVWSVVLLRGFMTNSHALVVVGIAIVIGDLVLLAAGVVLLRRVFHAMSEFLGVKVRLLNSPTFQDASFDRWCERNNVVRRD